MINFEEFQKIDLRVAKILSAEKVEGSDKLLKLQIDLGPSARASTEQIRPELTVEGLSRTSSGQVIRQIVVGIAKDYNPEDIIGKEIAVVANLEPRKVFGIQSNGMLLAADVGGQPVLLMPDKEVPPGTQIR